MTELETYKSWLVDQIVDIRRVQRRATLLEVAELLKTKVTGYKHCSIRAHSKPEAEMMDELADQFEQVAQQIEGMAEG